VGQARWRACEKYGLCNRPHPPRLRDGREPSVGRGRHPGVRQLNGEAQRLVHSLEVNLVCGAGTVRPMPRTLPHDRPSPVCEERSALARWMTAYYRAECTELTDSQPPLARDFRGRMGACAHVAGSRPPARDPARRATCQGP
jgi:hypothetical protein